MINGEYTDRKQSHNYLNTAIKRLRICGIIKLVIACGESDLFEDWMLFFEKDKKSFFHGVHKRPTKLIVSWVFSIMATCHADNLGMELCVFT